jgi:crotonobetainyl-CoA:carnitine CoA-transferase CaiB-like acyl-CoA transferase
MLKPLEGVKILDFSRYLPGPYATLRLLDWGAEVIKVESPEGDPLRFIGRINDEEGAVYRSVNRGKECIFADLKDEVDLARVMGIVQDSDVVLESFRPGVMDRLGLGYERLNSLNPRLVYCSISGYGQTGPYVTLSGHDINYMALSGMADQISDEQDCLFHPRLALADLVSGVVASEAILAGLVERSRVGKGGFFDISITEAVLLLLGPHIAEASLTGKKHGTENPSIAYHNYRTADGRYISLGAVESKFWTNFCKAVGRDDLVSAKNTPPVKENPAFQTMVEIAGAQSFEYWQQFFRDNDCCFAPVLSIDEVLKSDLVRERGLVIEKNGTAYLASHFLGNEDFLQKRVGSPKASQRD